MRRRQLTLLAILGLLVLAPLARTEPAAGPVLHVLLISIDGLHAVDLARYTSQHPQSTLAELSHHGDPQALHAVRLERTTVLPGLDLDTTP